MKFTSKIFLVGCAAMLVAAPALAAPPEGNVPDQPVAKITRSPLTHDQVWSLLQGSGPQLYQDLCASCHGLDGTGNPAVARALGTPPPDLTRLEEDGISIEHAGYVIRSACEDAHHRAPDGTPTMPCWRKILRHSLGSDVAAFPIITRLVNYVDSIQVATTIETETVESGGR